MDRIIRLAMLGVICALTGCGDMAPLGSPPSSQAAAKKGYFYPPMSMSPGGDPHGTP
jgi:predicted small lipoprotein YifL